MLTLRDIPPEILSLFCECLDQQDLRNVRLLNRAFDNAARRILFRTIFLKVNLHSFGKLSNISEHETLRHYVEVFIYDGRELEFAEGSAFEEWLHHTAATGIGMLSDTRDKFLARFSQQQLHEYYFNFCRYVRLVQGPILQGDNEIKWLLKAMRRFPRLSVVEYAENEQGFKDDDRELQPMSFFSPLAQETLAEPEEGWGRWDKHFWALVCAVFRSENPQQVKQLRGEMLDYESLRKVEKAIPQLTLKNIQLLCLEFTSEDHMSQASTRSLAALLKRAPNLTSLRLSYGDHLRSLENISTSFRSRLFDTSLHWKHLTNLSLQNLALSPSYLQQLLQRHSTTLLSLELSDMALQRGNETIEGGARALWITMIQFLSQSMSLKRIKLIGRFTTDTNEAWSTCGAGEDGSVCPPRQDGCLISRIEHFIIHGGLCPFTLRKPERLYDVHMDASHNEGPWIPKHSWSWEEDDTWRFAAFMIEGTLGEESFLEELLSVDTLIPG
ncbi:hypothetical protein VC83_07588 [Pseudogymnoascus destructans]|uniref:F-box domain-containing protein n=2 Tax=Pseudogymnoascus destructans TaxID=655981 RepID=L8GB63_PSED2|nr:uncharacterized protein VC83_07588 [Pseudogymnoascus destructans]ELR10084.1 hypothetical protein GMDG_04484 [Pseudogymnoascus destructans 20631-21]OAF55630.1 hypothetical protein VC83_07588 [Pseudogymnoascus destructans]